MIKEFSKLRKRKSYALVIGNLSTRRFWFTDGMADRAELDPGRGLRAKCKSLSKTTWNHHERWQNNSVENTLQRFALSFVSFLRRKHDFWWRISTFVWRMLFEEPRIWTSGFNLTTRVLKSVTAAQERLNKRSGCHAAKILPVGVRSTKNIWFAIMTLGTEMTGLTRVTGITRMSEWLSLGWLRWLKWLDSYTTSYVTACNIVPHHGDTI